MRSVISILLLVLFILSFVDHFIIHAVDTKIILIEIVVVVATNFRQSHEFLDVFFRLKIVLSSFVVCIENFANRINRSEAMNLCRIVNLFWFSFVVFVLSCRFSDASEVLSIRLTEPNCVLNDLLNFEPNENEQIEIVIIGCHVPHLLRSAFVHFRNIISLEIVNSSLSTIEKNALDELNHLKRLSLSGNNLATIVDWSSFDLNEVIELDLHRNAIRSTETLALNHFPQLQALILSDNLLTEIARGFFGRSSSIQTLCVNRNFLKTIRTDTFKSLLRLEHLFLQDNQISSIDSFAFAANVHLKTLRLDGNRISELDEFIFTLPRLIELNLSRNALSEIAIDFRQTNELRVLDLSFNLIRGFAWGTFDGLESLETLNLGNNRIVSIHEGAIRRLTRLRQLDLSHNNLNMIFDNVFASLESLESLNLSYNQIDSVSLLTFVDLKTLRCLNLSHNRLKHIEFVTRIGSIDEIDLRSNQIQNANFSAIGDVRSVQLSDNPWSCAWLIAELMVNDKFIADNVRLGKEIDDSIFAAAEVRRPEEVICYDNRNDSNYRPLQRHVVIVHPHTECNRRKLKVMIT